MEGLFELSEFGTLTWLMLCGMEQAVVTLSFPPG